MILYNFNNSLKIKYYTTFLSIYALHKKTYRFKTFWKTKVKTNPLPKVKLYH